MFGEKKLLQEESLPQGSVSVDNTLPWLFAGTLFVSATLLFLVEPMVAKMVLPLLGGTPSVWNTCMVFFQAMLLAGYAYAHVSAAWLSVRHQLLLHMALVSVPLVALPLGVTEDWVPPTEDNPVIWLLLLLLVSVGLPFFILAASTPLLQKWFATTGHPKAKDPYFLYAASNLGSMVALLGYPTIIEPLLPLKKDHWLSQCWLWTIGYGLLIVLVVRCIWVVGQALDRKPRSELSGSAQPVAKEVRALGVRTRLRWVALAFVPSSLMLGVTTFITLDVAAIPLFWVIPLALYLLSFILVFAKWPERLHNALVLMLPWMLLIVIVQMHSVRTPRMGLLLAGHLLVLFVVALVCHGELALSRPPPRYLTEFYLWLSVGGVLGGLFNALVAPAIFVGVAEYPIGLWLACLLLPTRHSGNPLWVARWVPRKLAKPMGYLADVAMALVLGLLSYEMLRLFSVERVDSAWLRHLRQELETKHFVKAGKLLGLRPAEAGAIIWLGIPLLLCYCVSARPLRFIVAAGQSLIMGRLVPRTEPLVNYLFVRRPLLFGLGVGTFMLNYLYWYQVSSEPVLYRSRTFYSMLKVESTKIGGMPLLQLTSGTTSHGAQWYHREPETMAGFFAPVAACMPADVALHTSIRLLVWAETDREPLTYFHRTGPIGQVFAEFSGPNTKKSIAVIGLGAGTLASYGEPGQKFLFFDIDPEVVKIAETYFTYLSNPFTYVSNCRAKWDVVLGDARLRMKLMDDRQFQLIIVDAFSSDAIPVHLLTREALGLYFQKLTDDGILALHISNRYLDLQPVLGNLAAELHLAGLFQSDYNLVNKPGKRASNWVLLAHREQDFGKLPRDPRWKPIEPRPEVGVWTDDYSNLLGVFRWN